MNSITSIISINADNSRKLMVYICEKIHNFYLLIKSGSFSINKEKFIKMTNEIIVFLIMVIGIEKTIKLFWNILKIMIGCGYTLRYLIMKKNIKNIENIENIEHKVNMNEVGIDIILKQLYKINTDIENINSKVENISKDISSNKTNFDEIRNNINFGVMGTDYYSPF